jgi:hypothetical protein
MKKLIVAAVAVALLCVVVASAGEKAASNTMQGWVSDVMCGAKGANAGHAECTKKCAEGGQMLVFVSDAEKKVWTVDNPETLKGHEGHHVAVTGHADATKGSVHIENVEMIAEASPDKGKNDGAHSHDKKKKT